VPEATGLHDQHQRHSDGKNDTLKGEVPVHNAGFIGLTEFEDLPGITASFQYLKLKSSHAGS
jgi:hypothetical protein